jgi:hypothetical protein
MIACLRCICVQIFCAVCGSFNDPKFAALNIKKAFGYLLQKKLAAYSLQFTALKT